MTYSTLLDQLTNLGRLAEFPQLSYRTRMAASQDRRATDPFIMDETNWQSNDDFVETGKWDQLVAVEERNGEKEFVLMDQEGPGVIQRIWFAQGGNAGNIRIYIDNQATPVIDLPVEEMFKSNHFPFLEPIVGIRAEGYNANLPIPYQTHCKVVVTRADERYWYQVTYRKYTTDVQLESFSMELAKQHEKEIRAVAEKFAHPMAIELPVQTEPKSLTKTLEPKGKCQVDVEANEGAVYQLKIRLKADEIEKVLRSTVLRIQFDGVQSVLTPVGDFFGSAPGINPFVALSSAVEKDGTMTSRWVMPFKKSVQIQVENYSDQKVDVDLSLQTGPREWTDRTMYFHAGWFDTGEISSRPRRDINVIELKGRGRYVGDMLHMANWNRDWWGEGDEKIWVDDEKFPGIFGTGVEDYYGYAICSPKLFSHVYHNQTRCDGPGNSGNISLARFHIADDIPFDSFFRFDLGIWHWDRCIIEKAFTSWWYAFPGTQDNLPRLNTAMLRLPDLPPPAERVGRNLFPNK